MAPHVWDQPMVDSLLNVVNTGLGGNIRKVVVLKKTNQKLKIADAWTAATKIFNNIWATSFNKTVIRKKYSSVVAKKRLHSKNS